MCRHHSNRLISTVLCVLFLITATTSLILSGSPSSYAKYPPWSCTLNTTLTLEFQTIHPSGLILYSDTQGLDPFFELKLSDGQLRLRYNSGSGANLIQVGRSLNDGLWHRVQLLRNQTLTVLSLDGFVSQYKYSKGVATFRSPVHVGGLPPYYNDKLGLLSLPSVVFEPKFRGAVRNVVYEGGDGVTRGQDVVEWKGLLSSSSTSLSSPTACEKYDPCLHGGFCISTDTGPLCDCKHIDFEGVHCEVEKPPATINFNSLTYIQFSNPKPIISLNDEISFLFKTRIGHGLLFYTGDGIDYLTLLLRDGKLILSVNLGGGPLETRLHPDHLLLSDGEWHSVRVGRRVQEITASLDSIYHDHWTLAGQFTMLSSTRVTVGGYSEYTTDGVATTTSRGLTNYTGCIKKLDYRADTLRLGLLDLAKEGHHLIKLVGDGMEFSCNEVAGHLDTMATSSPSATTVTFTTDSSYLTTPISNQNTVSLQFRTVSKSCILLHHPVYVLELYESNLSIVLGNGLRITMATNANLTNGDWHSISIKISYNGRGSARLDRGEYVEFNLQEELPRQQKLLFIGNLNSKGSARGIYTAAGFTGCLGSMVVDGVGIDLVSLARVEGEGTIRPHCFPHFQPHCTANYCHNKGACIEDWSRAKCDCRGTGFEGARCNKAPTTLLFSPSHPSTLIHLPPNQLSSLTISFTFRTPKPTGLLLDLRHDNNNDRENLKYIQSSHHDNNDNTIQFHIEFTRLKIIIKHGAQDLVLVSPHHPLSDNLEHSLVLSIVDGVTSYKLDEHDTISKLLPWQPDLNYSNLLLGYNGLNLQYEGELHSLKYNQLSLLDLVRAGQLEAVVLAKYKSPTPVAMESVVNFRIATTVGLQQLQGYSKLAMSFSIKTNLHNCILFYNGGKADYIYLLISNSKLSLYLDLGDGELTLENSIIISDGHWHSVIVTRAGFRHTLVVDSEIASINIKGENEHLDLNGVLYFGGLPRGIELPSGESVSSFIGCLGNLAINGIDVDLVRDAVIPGRVVQNGGGGCDHHDNNNAVCTPKSCSNNGACIQNLSSYTCDCDETTYTGQNCELEPPPLRFHGNEMLVYSLRLPKPDSRQDSVSFAMATTHEGDSSLVYINSETTSDFIQIRLVGGRLATVFNVGSGNYSSVSLKKLNDGGRHAVVWRRVGGNSSLVVDGVEEGVTVPKGPHTSIFNRMNQMYIGGHHGNNKQVTNPFRGLLSSLVVNKIRVYELIGRGDATITKITNRRGIHGNQEQGEDSEPMQKTPPSNNPNLQHDDLVSSGSGPCFDDEDSCVPLFDTGLVGGGSGDDLITPVYVPPPTVPTTTSTTSTTRKPVYHDNNSLCSGDDEDEDCVGGSGERAPPPPYSPPYSPPYQQTTTTTGYHSTTTTTANNRWDYTSHHGNHEPSSTTTTTTAATPTTIKYFLPPPTPTVNIIGGRVFDFPSSPASTVRPPHDGTRVVHADSSDSTLIIIIIIALLLIIIVSILIIFFMCKRRDDPIYKVEPANLHPGGQQQQLLRQQQQQQHPGGQQGVAGRKAGVKEWYV